MDNFRAVLQDHTAGSPTDEGVIWTDLNRQEIARRLAERGTPACVHVVGQLLDDEGYRRRQARKSLPMGAHQDRDAQFENIARVKQEYLDAAEPVLSIDTKRRELIGPFWRAGTLWCREPVEVYDHDFPRFAEGVVIPHGLFDPRLNRGYVHLGTSHDTSAFACDCLLDWWLRFGRELYPRAKSLLLLCDGGGSNSASTWLFRADLQGLADRTGLGVRVAHYPPYCSKYNPIEHRLFCHLSRACRGVAFDSLATVKRLMERARTEAGLRVVVDILDKEYPRGRKVADEVRQSLNVVHDDFLPRWNYRVLPRALKQGSY